MSLPKRLAQAASERLEAGEIVEVEFPAVANGLWAQLGWLWWFDWIVGLMELAAQPYAVVLTDRRLLLLETARWSNRPIGGETTTNRSDVRPKFRRSRGLSRLDLELPGRTIRLRVERPHRDEAERLARALTWTGA